MRLISYGHQSIDDNDIASVVEVLRSDFLTQGPKVRAFEAALCNYTGAQYAVAVSNGTAALHLACLAAEIKKGSEFITSPMTFMASANCGLYCGGTPVFADIEEDFITIDPQELEKKVTSATKALIPVHFAGHPCDLDAIAVIAKKNNLTVIEDGTHALGSLYKGIKIGACSHSDMTIFSFHPVKAITTGEGGAILTNNEYLYKRLLCLRNHGITKIDEDFIQYDPDNGGPWYHEMQELGYNYRFTDILAALGISQLKKLDTFIHKRRAIAEHYNHAFVQKPHIKIPQEKQWAYSAFHLYVLQIEFEQIGTTRKLFMEALLQANIAAQVHYIPVHTQPYYTQYLGYQWGDFPRAELYYQKAISIPLYPSMTEAEVSHVITQIQKLCR